MSVRPIDQLTPFGGTEDPNYPTQWRVPTDIDTELYRISGECFVTQLVIDELALQQWQVADADLTEEVKKRLCENLVQQLMKSKFIEFTHQRNMAENTKVFRARMYVVPDSQVRILREKKIIK